MAKRKKAHYIEFMMLRNAATTIVCEENVKILYFFDGYKWKAILEDGYIL